MLRPIVERCRVEIRARRPDDSVHLRIEADLLEQAWIPQRSEQFARENWFKINRADQSIIESQAQRIRSDSLDFFNAINRMFHTRNLA